MYSFEEDGIVKKLGEAYSLVHLQNWYSVLVNRSKNSFFKSGRVLRQGDPISPSLFMLSDELLSQMLNGLQKIHGCKGFYMNNNDLRSIIFCLRRTQSSFVMMVKKHLERVLEFLRTYEKAGQLINKSKSCFAVAGNASQWNIIRIHNITSMTYQERRNLHISQTMSIKSSTKSKGGI